MRKISNKELIAIAVSIIIILAFFGFRFNNIFSANDGLNVQTEISMTNPIDTSFASSVSGFEVRDIVQGSGAEATNGRMIVVHYTGALTDGRVFDSSYQRNQPFQFLLGAGQVIAGWERGFEGMRVGGKRQLVIPSDLAYGAAGIPGVIPGNATLLFEVELLDVR